MRVFIVGAEGTKEGMRGYFFVPKGSVTLGLIEYGRYMSHDIIALLFLDILSAALWPVDW